MLLISSAIAQTLANPPVTVDLTAIIIAISTTVISVIGTVGVALINSRMKDKNAAQALSEALTNSLGAVQNAENAALKSHPIQVTVPGISPAVAAGVGYVLDNAGKEANRFGITPEAIAQKIEARMALPKV